MTERECTHGQLARQCPICERDQRIEELEAENARLRCDAGAADIALSVTEAALATARETAVREFAEWLERSGPGCGMSLYHDMVGRGEETQVSFEEAAARFLAETGKEPK